MANSGDGSTIQHLKNLDPAGKPDQVLGGALIVEYTTIVLFRHLPAT